MPNNIHFDFIIFYLCSPMAWETGVQSQVESYPRRKKWYFIPPCLTLSIKRFGSRVKWSNPGNEGWSKGSLFNSYYIEVKRRVLLLSLDCSTLPSIRTLYCWVLSKEVSSTIFKVFGMMRPGIEPWSPGPLANTLPIRPWETTNNYNFK